MNLDNMHCGDCGMLVEPATSFHPGIYCRLFKLGVTDPAGFLEGQHFIPDPAHWGEDAPVRQQEATRPWYWEHLPPNDAEAAKRFSR